METWCKVRPVFKKHWVEIHCIIHLFSSRGSLLRVRGLITGCVWEWWSSDCLWTLITSRSSRTAVARIHGWSFRLQSLCLFHETITHSVSFCFFSTLLNFSFPSQSEGWNRPANEMWDLPAGVLRGWGKMLFFSCCRPEIINLHTR